MGRELFEAVLSPLAVTSPAHSSLPRGSSPRSPPPPPLAALSRTLCAVACPCSYACVVFCSE